MTETQSHATSPNPDCNIRATWSLGGRRRKESHAAPGLQQETVKPLTLDLTTEPLVLLKIASLLVQLLEAITPNQKKAQPWLHVFEAGYLGKMGVWRDFLQKLIWMLTPFRDKEQVAPFNPRQPYHNHFVGNKTPTFSPGARLSLQRAQPGVMKTPITAGGQGRTATVQRPRTEERHLNRRAISLGKLRSKRGKGPRCSDVSQT